ncbi:MAG: alpha-1,2-fucosyltransferase [Bacteroidales bacterium]|nr:alpha-1,2-fucosyltransferase [Bacteroidales bacterium]
MIIAKITSGLGNQMFQYAAARRLANYHNAELKLDISHFSKNKERTYDLKNLNIIENIATPNDIYKVYKLEGINRLFLRKIFGKGFSDKFNNLIERKFKKAYYTFNPETGNIPELLRGRILTQNFCHFDERILTAPDNVYMLGYWQSEKYFKDIEDIIRKEFTFKNPPQEKNEELSREIKGNNSVSIHIRRGDYINKPVVSMDFNICDTDYYLRSVDYISKQITNPVFYVFSDDISWVKENFKIPYPMKFVDSNTPENSFEDMRLMSLCKHNILANSSFSWWSAWLNENRNKIIVTPREWVRIKDYKTSDIVPDNWFRL